MSDEEKEETWIAFDGQNCDGPCRGWDGKSRRCECGNRRVSWDDDTETSAAAY